MWKVLDAPSSEKKSRERSMCHIILYCCSHATHEVVWLRSFLQYLNITSRADDPIEMCNNTAAI